MRGRKTGMVKVSIIVPVYNCEQYLSQCIESIINQSLQDIEIICVNDGSKDSSRDILFKYASNDSRIIIVDKHNRGYGHTINIGMSIARGEYLGIVESDDFIHENMYEILYDKAKQFELDVVKSNYVSVFSDSNKNEYFINNKILNEDVWYEKVISGEINVTNFIIPFATWSGIYRTEFIRQNKIKHNESKGASYQDVGFSALTTMMSQKLMYIREYLYRYRIDNAGSSVKDSGKVYCVFDEYTWIEEYFSSRPNLYNKYIKYIRAKCLHNYISEMNRIDVGFIPALVLRLKAYIEETKNNGQYTIEGFNADEMNLLSEIVENPQKASEFIITKKERKVKEFQNTLMLLKQYDNIAIYGAGVVGKRVFGVLLNAGLADKINCFAVTEKQEEKKVYGIEVKKIEEINNKCKAVIIAVSTIESRAALKEMEEKAKELGFVNILFSEQLLKDSFLN